MGDPVGVLSLHPDPGVNRSYGFLFDKLDIFVIIFSFSFPLLYSFLYNSPFLLE